MCAIHAIISKIINRGETLYCCFVDYQKAFDLVNRGFLWQKLIQNGCSNMFNALQSMYENKNACVRYKTDVRISSKSIQVSNELILYPQSCLYYLLMISYNLFLMAMQMHYPLTILTCSCYFMRMMQSFSLHQRKNYKLW